MDHQALSERFFERIAIKVHDAGLKEAVAVWQAWQEIKGLKPEGGFPKDIQDAVRAAFVVVANVPREELIPEAIEPESPPVVTPETKPDPPKPAPKPEVKPRPKPEPKKEYFPW